MQTDTKKMWDDCLSVIRDIVPKAAFEQWFEPIIPLSYEDHRLTIQVPSQFFYEYLEGKYVNVIKMTLNRVVGENTILKYRVMMNGQNRKSNGSAVTYKGEEPKTEPNHTPNKIDPSKAPGPFAVAAQDIDSQLNPRYNFSNFYEGESNKLVRAVSEKIAIEPGKTAFNPLFIYGPSGVGKTHICHAIGLKVKELYPNKRVLYISSNLFRLQYTNAVLKNMQNEFLSFYQSLDVLIVDDIHELIGMNKTQEIFFHIFNNLHQLGKQLILTCDRAPVDLQGLEERLISRLKWGMTACIDRPELELKKIILRNKIEIEGVELPDDVFDLVAESATDNVRDLEGILVSLMAHSVISNKEIDLDLAKHVISQSIRLERKQLTIKHIQETVCSYLHIDEALLQTLSRKREIVLARQLTMYFAKRYTDASFSHIGKVVGNKDHATVHYSWNLVKQQIEIDKKCRAMVSAIDACLKK
ncbi:MAG: chromosomal replication initiator protein DnaA [Tannerella sp.]|jgi:chromosomal replication initiator protein|nr:chromosomal replication initiator protein DnaA [Tannerella sp.]